MAKRAATKHKKELLKGGPSAKKTKVNPPPAAATSAEVRGMSGALGRMCAAVNAAQGTCTTSPTVSLVAIHLSSRTRTTGAAFRYMVGNSWVKYQLLLRDA